MPLLVDDHKAEAFSRLVSIRLTMLTLRWMENWRSGIDDCEKALILVAVMAISGERFTRGEELDEELKDLRNPVPPERLPPCNISSIAAATGLNRETARRKVIELAEAGILDRSPNGLVSFKSGFLERGAMSELVRRQLEAVVRVVNDLIRDGPVKIV
jgi:hypothetical protein